MKNMNNISKLTETFAFGDSYFTEFGEVVEDILVDGLENIEDITLSNCELRSIAPLCKESLWDMIVNAFEDDNSSENGDEWETAREVYDNTINIPVIEKFANEVPKLWWPTGDGIVISREEILEYIKVNEIEID